MPGKAIPHANVMAARMATTVGTPAFPTRMRLPSPPASPRQAISQPTGPILAATLSALRYAGTGAALLLRPGPDVEQERLRLARALLQQAMARGGTLLNAGKGEMLLLSADKPEVLGLQPILARLFSERPDSARLWDLPRDTGDLLSWSETANPATAPSIGPAADPRRFSDALMTEPLDRFLRRQILVRPGATMEPAGLRILIDQPLLLTLAGGDANLAAHGRMLLSARCRQEIALQGKLRHWIGSAARPPLLFDLSIDGRSVERSAAGAAMPAGPATHLAGFFAVLPIGSATFGMGAGALRSELAPLGSGLALDGIDADLLRLMRPSRLQADLLIVRWSPALLALEKMLREARPDRVLLDGCDEPAAIGFAARLGFTRVSGELPDRLFAMARMASCPHNARCKLEACMLRARAIGAAGREGCMEPGRLSETPAMPR